MDKWGMFFGHLRGRWQSEQYVVRAAMYAFVLSFVGAFPASGCGGCTAENAAITAVLSVGVGDVVASRPFISPVEHAVGLVTAVRGVRDLGWHAR